MTLPGIPPNPTIQELTMIHPIYLPFSREQLLPHFSNEKHLDYFVSSAIRYTEFMARFGATKSGMPITPEVRLNRQVEKDERFWTACTLKTVFDNAAMASALRAAFREQPPLTTFSTWEECIGERGDQDLRFEVAVSSPRAYREALRAQFHRMGPTAHLVPYVVDAAQGRTAFEGATKVDAVFRNRKNGFCVLFEAKVLSDISCDVTFDPLRNQLARNVDVMVDNAEGGTLSPDPAKRLLCLLTPRVFQVKPTTRFYGLLYHEYKRNPGALTEHLPHRDAAFLRDAASRLGWLTFEDCLNVCPACCPWLAVNREGVVA